MVFKACAQRSASAYDDLYDGLSEFKPSDVFESTQKTRGGLHDNGA